MLLILVLLSILELYVSKSLSSFLNCEYCTNDTLYMKNSDSNHLYIVNKRCFNDIYPMYVLHLKSRNSGIHNVGSDYLIGYSESNIKDKCVDNIPLDPIMKVIF